MSDTGYTVTIHSDNWVLAILDAETLDEAVRIREFLDLANPGYTLTIQRVEFPHLKDRA